MKKYVYSEAKQVVVCGDIHGEFRGMVYNMCDRFHMSDTLLIVAGDCGFGFERIGCYEEIYQRVVRKLRKYNNWLVFVRGNHDDPSYFNEEKLSHNRFRCVPDYSVIEVCDRNILCVGGGISIDRKLRKEANVRLKLKGVACYWPDESPVYDPVEIEIISKYCSIDTVVTHTAPSFCPLHDKHGISSWITKDSDLSIDLDEERKLMDQIYCDLLKYHHPLKRWYYGHFHESATTHVDNVVFKMLDINEMSELR